MVGLSSDIQLAVETVLQGLELPIDIVHTEDDKIKRIMDSKVASFRYSKELLDKWLNSPNAPSSNRLREYVERLYGAGGDAVDILRNALRKPIDYETLEQVKIADAVKAKSTILEYIRQLEGGLLELKLQIDSDKFNLSSREFKLGFPERFAKGEFFNYEAYHKEWHNEKEDTVMICPYSTKGEVIEMDGLKIQLPKKPKDKTKILYHNLPKKEQYWRREEEPEGLNVDSEEAFTEYIYEQYRKRREGVWFMNNGKATYLTGEAWFALQHCKMKDDGGYMNFRIAQLHLFYFAKACLLDPRCLGQLFVKSRRTGYTYIILAIMLNFITSTRNINMGLTSQNDDDAKKAFKKFTYMFRNLPFYFKPVVRGAIGSEKELEFALPSDKSKQAKLSRKNKGKDYLNSYIDYQATKDGSYDGQKMYIYLGDECVSPETEILMADLTYKKALDIKIGDYVMSGSGNPEKVIKVSKGKDRMYKVIEPYGVDYIVSSQHKLKFEQGNSKKRTKEVIMTPEEYLDMSDYKKKITRRKVWKGCSFPYRELPIDPYTLGVWLGDGSSNATQFTLNPKKDKEILEYLISDFDSTSGFEFKCIEKSQNWEKWYLKDNLSIGNNQTGGKEHRFKKELRLLNIWGNKRIPKKYLTSSREQRLNLLAGIIDTDGYLYKNNNIEISMSRKELIDDIIILSGSLGLDVSVRRNKKSNYNTDVYSLTITDYDSIVPCKVKRKKPKKTPVLKRRTKVDVEYNGVGEYVGFQLENKGKEGNTFVLKGGSVTSNCGKWKKPANYENHWGRISPTFDEGGEIVGKAFLGSTVNPMKQGGQEFKALYYQSIIAKRDPITERTPSGLYSYFLPAHKNMTRFTDKYGVCWETTPPKDTLNQKGTSIKHGSIAYLEAKRKAKKKESPIAYNEELRANPMNVLEAFRDEAKSNILPLEKITEQIEYNETSIILDQFVTRGNFMWKDGVLDTEVVWYPDPNGRFLVSWLPPAHLQNNKKRNHRGVWTPLNSHMGCFGADTYDISGTVSGKGSKGALSGVLGFNMSDAPSNTFFLEYINRTEIAETFFEDLLMALVFYGMPVLAENNKPRFLYHLKNRGYRGFSLNRPDRAGSNLSKTEREIGGIPSSSSDVITTHASMIENFIVNFVGTYDEPDENKQIREYGSMGNMFFLETLKDWLGFDISNREKSDATISSGYALMGLHRAKLMPVPELKPINLGFTTYSQSGNRSRKKT